MSADRNENDRFLNSNLEQGKTISWFFPCSKFTFPWSHLVLRLPATRSMFLYHLFLHFSQLFLLFNNLKVNRWQCVYFYVASWWKVPFITCTERDFPALATIIPVLCFASHVKLDVPVLDSASHMKLKRAPENATFGTSNEIYYFSMFCN
jgi:hypothetical protein